MKRSVLSVTIARMSAATVFSAALVLAAPAAFAQTPAPAAATRTADQLEDQVETKWKADAALAGTDIDIEVKDGVATLTGETHTAAQKSRAARLAKVDGITSVVNHIEVVRPGEKAEKAKAGLDKAANKTGEAVGTAAGATREGVGVAAKETKKGVETAAEKTGEGLSKAGEKTGEALGTAANKTKGAAKATGEAASDGWITTKVKSKFVGEKPLKGSDISVSTNEGIVTLTGTVPNDAAKTHAIALVKATKGVKDVVDNTTIGPKTN